MNRVDCLDGLRGVAALWVMLGHAMILTGFHVPIVDSPDLGVDLFILLSGYLMVFQYDLRKEREDWSALATWFSFWVRRFFRIAPLYFLLLGLALAAGETILSDRNLIDTFLDRPLQKPDRYMDSSFSNILLHLTFLFGLIPGYSFRTPLPDWSLGLEMQFYAFFPFFMLLVRKIGWLQSVLAVTVTAIVVVIYFSALHIVYPMPSFLPLKLHLFLAGMVVAANAKWSRKLRAGVVVALAAIPIGGHADLEHLIAREAISLTFFGLFHAREIEAVGRVARALSSRVLHWLGELSYGVYLIHLLIMHRVAAWAIAGWGNDLSSPERFLMVTAIVVPLTYGSAYVLYVLVERNGQLLGKRLLQLMLQKRSTALAI